MITTLSEALKYVREKQTGTVEELEKEISPKIVSGFFLTGELSRRLVKDSKGNLVQGWSFSKRGEETYQFAFYNELYKPTFLDKLESFYLKNNEKLIYLLLGIITINIVIMFVRMFI